MTTSRRPPKSLETATHRDSVVRREASMPEVAKKVLSVHLRKMEANEKGTKKGEDMEKLHDMRVAVRRMRTAAKIFGRFLDPDEFRPFARELRALGRGLGPVRDMDVILDHARGFHERLPMRERLDFENLLTLWQDQRSKLRDRLLEHLESSVYRRFKKDFGEFLADASAGVLPVVTKKGRVRPSLLSHEGPVVLFERLAALRAYEGWLDGDDIPLRRYHRLRIDVKRIRYTFEFMSDVIGPEAAPLIASFKAVQDHLGEMREAWITADLIEQDFLPLGVDGPKAGAHPGIAAYLTARRTRSEELRKSFPDLWRTVNNREVHRRIAAIAASF